MAKDHFEVLVEKQIEEETKAVLALPLGDSLRDAHFKGRITGLKLSLDLYRKAARVDADGDGI